MEAKSRTSVSDGLPYVDFCNKVMADETGELLKDFRRKPDYDLVVPGNRKGKEVFEHVELIKKEYPEMLQYMPWFEHQSGVFGNPTTHKFDIGTLDVPMVLHIYYLALTWRAFGSLEGMRICEIGPGAGLFFKAVTDVHQSVRYTFVDLPGPLFINKKHVEFLGREKQVEEYLSCDAAMIVPAAEEFDLLISDCGFNELHMDVQAAYIKTLLNRAKRGRIAFYEADLSKVLPNMNILEVFRALDKKSKMIKMDLRVPTLYWDES